jgi:putative nucleotidyltransferase with HDIG domain
VIPIEDITASVKSLPTLPVAVAQVIQLTSSSDSSLADFERVVKPDPALTANILRVANSVRYRGVKPSLSVRDGIGRLGIRGLFEIAAGHALVRVIPDRLPGYDLNATRFWTHSVAVGIFTQKLLKGAPGDVRDVAFTAGLLHDLGKLVIGAFLEQKVDAVRGALNQTGLSFITAERDALGTDHAEVGLAVAHQWKLPDAVASAARWHHSPHEAAAGAPRRIASAVHLANCLAHTFGYGADLGELHRTLHPSAMELLAVTMRDLEKIASESVQEILELTQALKPPNSEAK